MFRIVTCAINLFHNGPIGVFSIHNYSIMYFQYEIQYVFSVSFFFAFTVPNVGTARDV